MQAEVIRLRDVAGWSSEEVRNALDLTETNQRVLLHRARAKVRRALDDYLEADAMSAGGDLACQDLVELLTDYLEGTLPADGRGDRRTPGDVRRLHDRARADARDDRASPAASRRTRSRRPNARRVRERVQELAGATPSA